MSNDFAEIQRRLLRAREDISNLARLMAKAQGPSFDIMSFPIKNFTGYETQNDIVQHITTGMPEQIVAKDLELLHNSITLLRITTIVIEAQKVLQDNHGERGINSVQKDNVAFHTLFQSVSRHGNDIFNRHTNEKGRAQFAYDMNAIAADYAVVKDGEYAQPLKDMNRKELIEKIFDLRLNAAERILTNLEINIDKAGTVFEAALIIRKSLNEGILPDNVPQRSLADTLAGASAHLLPKSGKTAQALHDYLANVYEMSSDEAAYDKTFLPVRNVNAALSEAVKFIP